MQYLTKIILAKALLCSVFSFTLYANTPAKIPEVDEKLIDTMLSRLIYGQKCDEMAMISHFDPSVLSCKIAVVLRKIGLQSTP